jgi:hypothetical protein
MTCLWLVLPIAAFLVAGYWLTTLQSRRRKQVVIRAREQFAVEHDRLQSAFLSAAAATGKPRGLAWNECLLNDGVLLARDRATNELLGFAAATISFSAIEGGGMEDVEAVGNLRAATAVFHWDGQRWTTRGRTIFNLEPAEVLERYRESLEPIAK